MIDGLLVATVDGLGGLGLVGLGLAVAAGSLVPVLPTGALVAASAVVALNSVHPALSVAEVFLAAALGAFLGDAGQLLLATALGGRLLHRLARGADPGTLARAHGRLAEHRLRLLVVSRLLPAGRIPVVLAVVLVSFPARRLAGANAVAVVVWASCYVVLGGIGASVFPTLWEGVLAAVVLVVLVALAPTLVRRVREQRDHRELTHEPHTGPT